MIGLYTLFTKFKIDKFGNNEIHNSDVKSYRNLNRVFAGLFIFTIVLTNTAASYFAEVSRERDLLKIELDSIKQSQDNMDIDICLNRLGSIDKTKLLIDAIAYVESGDNEKCPGGGALQITRVCIDAANRFQKKVHYEYEDRYSREKSVEIWHIIQDNCNKSGDIEKAIRIWNGGPGYTKAGTQGYYEKVMKRYNYLVDQELEKICRQYKSLSIY